MAVIVCDAQMRPELSEEEGFRVTNERADDFKSDGR